jgi:hypothetical protein
VNDARPYAVISCDLDTVDRHLQGYGIDRLPPCDRIYHTAVPRLLDLLNQLGVPAVLFTIARDAFTERALLRTATRAGHEIASHSLTHPQPFSILHDEALHEELAGSRARLAEVTGTEIAGFRAPAWDADARVLAAVREAGYRYDASVFPTPALLASRLAAYRRSTGKRSIFAMEALGHTFARQTPHRSGGLVEFPIAVTRWLRFPVYHTVSYLVPPFVFRRALARLLRSRLPVCYEFHAADLLDLVDDGIDTRMARHPGMRVPLARKRAALRDVIATISRERRIITYAQALEELAA